MRRLRSNQLTPPPAAPAPAPRFDFTIAGLTVLGLVANPKTHEPALVVTDGEYVSIRSLGESALLRRLGRGYYEEERNEPERLTGFPRSHTPDGVVIKGKGWGTALYTALTLGAHQEFYDRVKLRMRGTGDGICSWTDNRSNEADKWWASAVKIGLAETRHEEETEKDENVDLELSPSDLDRFVDEGEVVYVNSVNVDIEKTTKKDVEVLEYEAADGRHLVCAAMNVEIPKGVSVQESLELLWREVQEDSDWVSEADPYALLALDVRGLAPGAMNLLSLLFAEAKLDDAARDELFLRHKHGLDPGMTSGQGRLFNPNQAGMSDVVLAREACGWDELAILP